MASLAELTRSVQLGVRPTETSMRTWDRTRKWVLRRIVVNRWEFTVIFAGEEPNVKELMAHRSLISKYAHLPPAELKSMIGLAGKLDFGVFPLLEGERLKEKASALGLRLEERDASYTSYLPVDTTGGAEVAMV